MDQDLIRRLTGVVLTNVLALIRIADYRSLASFRNYCEELQKDLKYLSEVLICVHFCHSDHPLSRSLLDGLRAIILHQHTLQAIRQNPLLTNWLLNAVALLQDHYDVTCERNFAFELVDRFGLHPLDAPSYRLEENKYLLAKLKGEKYTPVIDETFERNFSRLSRDQVYALTHLLFYVSDYGMSPYSCSPARKYMLEHLIYDAYLNDDVDVMLELMLVYRVCDQSEKRMVVLFEHLLLKRILSCPQMHHAMTNINSEHFSAYYHQCLLASMYCGKPMSVSGHADANVLRELRRTHAFHSSLRSANYVNAAMKFVQLRDLDPDRRSFCRTNFDHYIALQRHQLNTNDALAQETSRHKSPASTLSQPADLS